MKAGQILNFFCRIALAVVFIAAALPKILHPHDFALAVFRYQLAPWWLINIAAIFLPWIELTGAVVLLCVARWRAATALLLLGLLAFFTTAIAIDLVRGIDIACGCFSVNPEVGRIGALSIFRNVLLMLAAGVVLLREFSSPSVLP